MLILDNFEHLLEGAGLLADMLAYAPGLKVLVTSRERLKLRWEWFFFANWLRACPWASSWPPRWRVSIAALPLPGHWPATSTP